MVLISIVIVIVNDRLLEPGHPGVLTGKLSDVFGLVVLGAIAVDLVAIAGGSVPTVAAALACVAGGFAWVKCTATGASWYERLNQAVFDLFDLIVPGSLGLDADVVVDPTDLVALPALTVPLLIWWRH